MASFINLTGKKFKEKPYIYTNNNVTVATLLKCSEDAKFSNIATKSIGIFLATLLTEEFDIISSKSILDAKKYIADCLFQELQNIFFKNIDRINKYLESKEGKLCWERFSKQDIIKYLSKQDVELLFDRKLFDTSFAFIAFKDNKYIVCNVGSLYALVKDNNNIKELIDKDCVYMSDIVSYEKAYKDANIYEHFKLFNGILYENSKIVLSYNKITTSIFDKLDDNSIKTQEDNALVVLSNIDISSKEEKIETDNNISLSYKQKSMIYELLGKGTRMYNEHHVEQVEKAIVRASLLLNDEKYNIDNLYNDLNSKLDDKLDDDGYLEIITILRKLKLVK